MECSECGMEIANRAAKQCPKCEAPIRGEQIDELYRVDVAHRGEDRFEAQRKIARAIGEAQARGYKGIRIIHGYGSKPGHTNVIHGVAVRYLQDWVRRNQGAKLTADKRTPGAHVLYFDQR